MPEWNAPGDWIIDGHVIRQDVGQTTGYPARSDPPTVCNYADEYFALVENEAPVIADFGERVGAFVSLVRKNPWTRAQQPTSYKPA